MMDDYNAARDYMLQMANEISRLRAENEKLRHELDAETDQARKDVVYFDELRAEIERLRKLLSDTNTYYAECIAAREDLRAENGRLRAALKPFADAADDFIAEKHDMTRAIVSLGHLRAAAAALKETE